MYTRGKAKDGQLRVLQMQKGYLKKNKKTNKQTKEQKNKKPTQFSSSVLPSTSLGFTIFGEMLAYLTDCLFSHTRSHILSSWAVHTECAFVVNIHLSRA